VSVRPFLDDWEIPRVSGVETFERRELVDLRVPGRTGSLIQDLGTAPTEIVIAGSLYGEDARREFLETVRAKFSAGTPLPFVADVLTATTVEQVVLVSLKFEQSAERHDEVEYVLVLRESPPPPPPPDPLGGLDSDLLAQAGGLVDSVTGALDAIDALGNVPNIGDPTPQVREAMNRVSASTEGLRTAATLLGSLFGEA
jgi:hypothetical protein